MGYKTQSINIFLLDGNPEGIRRADIPMSTITGIAFKMNQLGKAAKEFAGMLNRPGVYIRFGADESGKPTAYIGESEDVFNRLKQWKLPQNNDENLQDVIAFVNKSDIITKSHVRFAEAELIKDAQQNQSWHLPNKQNPKSAGKLSQADEIFMRRFIEEAKVLTGVLGCHIFKMAALQKQAVVQEPAAESVGPMFQMSGTGYQAKATVLSTTGEILVLADSIARKEQTPACPKGASTTRETLLRDGILQSTDQGLQFMKDHPFSSASAAACVVAGSSVSGPIYWKSADGSEQSYGEWKDLQVKGSKV